MYAQRERKREIIIINIVIITMIIIIIIIIHNHKYTLFWRLISMLLKVRLESRVGPIAVDHSREMMGDGL